MLGIGKIGSNKRENSLKPAYTWLLLTSLKKGVAFCGSNGTSTGAKKVKSKDPTKWP